MGMEEINMCRADRKDYLELYMKDTLNLIPSDSHERASFESSMEGMKDFLLHCEGLHLYVKKDCFKNSKNQEMLPLVYGYRDPGSSEDALFMIRGGLVEE